MQVFKVWMDKHEWRRYERAQVALEEIKKGVDELRNSLNKSFVAENVKGFYFEYSGHSDRIKECFDEYEIHIERVMSDVQESLNGNGCLVEEVEFEMPENVKFLFVEEYHYSTDGKYYEEGGYVLVRKKE